MYYRGEGVEKDYVMAAEWYKKAADQGSVLSQYKLSVLYTSGEGVEKNDVIAFSWCLCAAEQGYALAQYESGINYLHGYGVDKSIITAARWFSKAADQQLPEAQFELGDCYLVGIDGFNGDPNKAIDLYLKAANQGYAKAQCQLGYMYTDGTGTRKDYGQAVYWLRQAADQDDLGGQAALAAMYKNGHGVKQSDEDAMFWFSKSADQGDRHSQEQLSKAYKDGTGVTKDLNRSVYWRMKCNLNEDGDSIRGTFLDISLSAGLIEFIAQNLNEKKEFKQVTKLDYTQNVFSDDEILGVCTLIRKDLKIKSLVLSSYKKLSNSYLELLIEALDANTHLTEFIIRDYFMDNEIKDRIADLLTRNKAIAELRKYVLDFPLVHTASFALDPLLIVVDKTIVSYMINGNSKEETKNAVDNLFTIASNFELEAKVKN
jgi:hypothetical protein